MAKHSKLYENSHELKRDEETGEMDVHKKSPADAGSDGSSGEMDAHMKERASMHKRHEEEQKSMHDRHQKDLKEMHKRHADTGSDKTGSEVINKVEKDGKK